MRTDWKTERQSQYAKKLRDPRWQKKRLEILQRDDFTCQRCFNNEATLNVHHNYYKQGNDPWDYPETAFVTLCEECHQSESELRKQEEAALLDCLRKTGCSAGDVNDLLCSLYHTLGEGYAVHEYDFSMITWVIRNFYAMKPELTELQRKWVRQREESRKNAASENSVEVR